MLTDTRKAGAEHRRNSMSKTTLAGLVGALAALLAAGCDPTGSALHEPTPRAESGVRWALDWVRICPEGGQCVVLDMETIAERFPVFADLPNPTYATREDCLRAVLAFGAAFGAAETPGEASGCKPVEDAAPFGWTVSHTTVLMNVRDADACGEADLGQRKPLDFGGPAITAFVECPRESPGVVRLVMTLDVEKAEMPQAQYDTRQDCLKAARAIQDPEALTGLLAMLAEVGIGDEEEAKSFEQMLADGDLAFEHESICRPTQ